MLLLLPCLAFATEDTLGGDDTYNNDSDMLKLVEVDVRDAAAITHVEFAVYSRSSRSPVIMVLYEAVGGGTYHLVDEVEATLPGSEEYWATADMTWVLEPGVSYAIGAYVGSDWYYWYDEGRTDNPWFGEVTGSYRVEDRDHVPETFSADREDYYYLMKIVSEDADRDADGVVAEAFGGQDCDDNNAAVLPGAVEICDDGLDNDCVGGDEACDDTLPGDDTGPDPGDDTGPDPGDDTAVDVGDDTGDVPGRDNVGAGGLSAAGACGCDTGAPTTALAGLLLAGLAGARRRRA